MNPLLFLLRLPQEEILSPLMVIHHAVKNGETIKSEIQEHGLYQTLRGYAVNFPHDGTGGWFGWRYSSLAVAWERHFLYELFQSLRNDPVFPLLKVMSHLSCEDETLGSWEDLVILVAVDILNSSKEFGTVSPTTLVSGNRLKQLATAHLDRSATRVLVQQYHTIGLEIESPAIQVICANCKRPIAKGEPFFLFTLPSPGFLCRKCWGLV